MLSGLNLSQTIDYTLKNDTDPKTVFKLGVIPSYIFASISEDGGKIDTVYQLLQVGLKGWENFGGIEYETVKEKLFGRELDIVPLSVVERIPLSVVTELSLKVMEINQLSDGERKN
jgi:hypothetical protein